jgi:hypothetical protein
LSGYGEQALPDFSKQQGQIGTKQKKSPPEGRDFVNDRGDFNDRLIIFLS